MVPLACLLHIAPEYCIVSQYYIHKLLLTFLVPSKAATNITGHFVNSTAILVSWDPIPVVYDPSIEDPICCVHGNLTGYTIFYSRVTKERIHNVTIDISYFEKHKMLRNETNHTIPFNQTNITQSSKMHFTLIGLDSHKNYTIYVVGNTKKGHGVWGEPIYVQTDEDGNYITILF